jgi:hypothetical protein
LIELVDLHSCFSDRGKRKLRQQLLLDNKLHLTVLQLMDLDCPLFHNKDTGKVVHSELLNAAHEILQVMTHGNHAVQLAVAPSLELLLTHASVVPTLPVTLRALFEGNREMCQEIPDHDTVINVMMNTMKHNTS